MSTPVKYYDADSTTRYMKMTESVDGDIRHSIIDSLPAITLSGGTTVEISAMPDVYIGGFVAPIEVDKLPAQHIDAFSRLRVSDPAYRFDSQFTYMIDSDLWDQKQTGTASATHDATNRMVTLSAAAGAGPNEYILQSHYHSPYTAGRGAFAVVTFCFGPTPEAGGEREAGYTDGDNGIYVLQTSTGISLGLRTTTAADDELIPQDEWNIDPFDGSGPSGLIFDPEATQILASPLQALYVGLAVAGFDIDGNFYPAHQFKHANVFSKPYIAQASLPVRYRVKATGTAAPVTMDCICSSVMSEGGQNLQDIPGRTFVASNKLTFRSVNGGGGNPGVTKYPVLAIECVEKLNNIKQNAVVIPIELEMSLVNTPGWVDVILRPTTLTAGGVEPTWTTPESGSTVRYTVNADALTGGTVVGGFYVPAAANTRASKGTATLDKVGMCYSHLLGKGDQLVLAVSTATNANGTAGGTILWKEIR